MNRKIVIVGGGTAGWMAAGYLSKYQGGHNITVIESPNIPKIGVGESVTPHVANFFDEIGVPLHHWMKHTGAVYKYANKFVGWKSGKGESEYFSFNYTVPAKNFYKDITPAITQQDFSDDATNERTTDYLLDLIKNKKLEKFDKYFNPQYHYMEKNVSPFSEGDFLLNGPHSFAQHINAELAGNYIRDHIAKPSRVSHKLATVVDISHKGDIIEYVELETGEKVHGDIFIDCTGFSRVLVGKLGWKEKLYENNLIDAAWVCQTEYVDPEKEMVNYTQSIAEPNGWRFKIGLYHRMGNGYCYSTKHTSDNEALNYFIKQIGPQRNKPRLIKWRPGRLEKFGSGNVAAIGLSCGFVEPLEANALYTIITSIRRLNNVLDNSELNFDLYNEKMAYTIDDIADFILLHYTLSSRSDTSFWLDMRGLGKKLQHENHLWAKYEHPKNTMKAAITGYTMFPDYMWAQLGSSWDINKKIKPLDKTTLELAELYFSSNEKKHNIISNRLTNSYQWLKENIFDNMDLKEWEKKYIKN
jgi:tryptophan 6-halogenase